MIITFCGHSDFAGNAGYEKAMLSALEEWVGEREAEFYLGNYGGFDGFAFRCCKKYKESHSNVSLIFVTPYMKGAALKEAEKKYDAVFYPDLENVPPRFAISRRNCYMVQKAALVICYIKRSYGGAYATYKLAKQEKKTIINLADYEKEGKGTF